MTSLLCICAALLAVSLAKGEVVNFSGCRGDFNNTCAVTEVRIDPCKEKQFCKLRRNEQATMTFDFTPNFSTSKLKFGLFWSSGNTYFPYPTINSDNGCDFTNCPIQAGQSQVLTYGGRIGKKLPTVPFRVQCKIWNEEDENQVCCFETTIKIMKERRDNSNITPGS